MTLVCIATKQSHFLFVPGEAIIYLILNWTVGYIIVADNKIIMIITNT